MSYDTNNDLIYKIIKALTFANHDQESHQTGMLQNCSTIEVNLTPRKRKYPGNR